jgi:hypothetical protein
MKTLFTTRDLGIAIRDHIEEHRITHFRGDLLETELAGEIAGVDVSDPSNLRVHLDNGQSFRVRIFSEGAP